MQLQIQAEIHRGADIIELINSEATWKDLLIGLVEKNQFDPWNIDISEIVDSYVDTVKSMKVLDLRVPANIILAAAILLRLKSSLITITEETEIPVEEAHFERPEVTVEGLNFRLRIPPKRKVSLHELIEALDEAMKIKEVRQSLAKPIVSVPITISTVDIEKEIEELYRKVKKNAGKDRMITFSALANVLKLDDLLLGLFIPLLFMAQRGKVMLMQEKFFDEIIVSLQV
ncbi:MAG: segregation/condensation protein A [Candidatus Micrarchaeota archaeon]|nr:segregation/condensation protein A [Candidatus Micrarchaeota archaeon]MDE1824389.1 segregation/condensation protein A [Candidatus Micrarchaeota archaeon]MDE1849677.1 segregation/condensation protein A [Candidatus Micrarchaeota archaeon]